MIHFVHRGYGGKYSTYVKDTVKRISRHRVADISNNFPAKRGYTVSVSCEGKPLTTSSIKRILDQQQVTFVFGDSKGLPQDILDSSDEIVSVSSLPVAHQLEAAIVTEQIEKIVVG